MSVASGRLAYVLGLMGPTMTVDTACSSSLLAVHLACQSLRAGECDLALAAGVNLVLSPLGNVFHSRLRGLAPDGRCKSFDAAADGLVRSDGCGVAVLKPLSAALRDQDRILAVIRASATNQDGRSNGLTAPNGPAQEAVIRQALNRAGLRPEQIGYVEAHGTGTPLGDPIELQALGAALGRSHPPGSPLYVGTVKTNLGHTEGAAGVAGLTKAVLALQHQTLPPNLHFRTPTPLVDWQGLHLQVPRQVLPWLAEEGHRVAGVSAFGISGTNVHVLLEEAPRPPEAPPEGEAPRLFPLSARCEESLRLLAERSAQWIEAHPEVPLADLCHTAGLRRTHFDVRLALVARSSVDLLERLRGWLECRPTPAPARETLHLHELIRLYVAGSKLDWSALAGPGRLVDLPGHPFQRTRFPLPGNLARPPAASSPSRESRLFELAFRASAPPPTRPLPGRWLVAGRGPLARALAGRLPRALQVETPSDLPESLLPEIEGVVCLWALDLHEPEPVGSAALEGPLGGLLRLVQTLVASPPREEGVRLVVATRGACSVAGEAPTLLQAPTWGLGRVVCHEHPELDPRLVDLDPGAPEDSTEALEALLAEMASTDSENQVAWRRGRRHLARLARLDALPESAPPPLAGPWLVSGGLGNLGRLVAERLAARGAQALALLSRRQPHDEELAWLEGLREKGVEVGLWSADLTDPGAVEEAVQQIRSRLGPLRGVVHCAGLLDDGVLTEQTWERFLPVLAPKLEGAWNLHRSTRQDPLEAFVLFSSVAATLGSAGQANYSAANAFLEALAESRRAAGLPALAIGWGPWTVGMGAELRPEHRERLVRQGLGFLEPREGLDLFESLLGRSGRVLALKVDFEALRPWVGRELRPLLAECLPLSGKEPEPSIQDPEKLVRLHASRILGLSPETLDPRRPLRDYGLDSLMALELRKELGQALGRNLPATLAFDQPTIEEQAAFLRGLLDPLSTPGRILPDSSRLPSPPPGLPQGDPVAVIGIGCHYPGGAEGPEAFWELLVSGRDAITEVPPERWDAHALYDPDPQAPGRMVTRWGGFLPDVDRFDASFFGIPPREARVMDPQQRLLLQTAWEALEDASLPPESLQGTPTGVFVGLSTLDYFTMLRDAGQMDPWASTGVAPSVAAGRLAYQLGLKGPALALDTACSSSLLAVHLACQSLRTGECDLALAGGVNLILSPETSCVMSAMGALSPSGRSRVFDAAADGYVRSDGCALVVLKPLSAALHDGDRILALVRGSAANQDGRSNGLTAPHGPSQEAVIRRALERAGVEPWQVDYVEAHGVGTPLSDPLELQALGAALGPGRSPEKPLLVGSVKSQIGHAESAAGVAGLIKTVLALRHRRLPANLHFHTPNPLVPWAELPLRVVDRLLPWPQGPGPRLAGVSAFGISGTNVHLVLEEAPEPPAPPRLDRPWHLLPLSARSLEALRRQARNFALALEGDQDLGALCHSAACGRSHLAHRLALLCHDPAQAARDLRDWADSGEVPARMRVGQGPGASPGGPALLGPGLPACRDGAGSSTRPSPSSDRPWSAAPNGSTRGCPAPSWRSCSRIPRACWTRPWAPRAPSSPSNGPCGNSGGIGVCGRPPCWGTAWASSWRPAPPASSPWSRPWTWWPPGGSSCRPCLRAAWPGSGPPRGRSGRRWQGSPRPGGSAWQPSTHR